MLDKYYKFKADSFLKDYKTNKKQLAELNIQYKNVLDEGGMDYSKPVVSGGGTSDVVARKASRREQIGNKIAELEEYFRIYNLIVSELTEEEKYIVDNFILATVPKSVAQVGCMKHMHVQSTEFYRRLDRLRYKIQEIADVVITR